MFPFWNAASHFVPRGFNVREDRRAGRSQAASWALLLAVPKDHAAPLQETHITTPCCACPEGAPLRARAIAARLSTEKPTLLVGRTHTDLDAACLELRAVGRETEACSGDVAEPSTAAAAIELARSRGWYIEHLVCNAGLGKSGLAGDINWSGTWSDGVPY